MDFDIAVGGKGLGIGVNMIRSGKHWEAKVGAAWSQVKRLEKLPWAARRTVIVSQISAILGYGAELYNTTGVSQ